MKEVLAITKALSDRTRVRALMCLAEGELCVCQLIEMLGLAPSTVSKHMAVLYQAGLAESRKQGRWIYYRLPGRDAGARVSAALHWVRHSLRDDPQIAQDVERLKAVRKIGKDKLCDRYRT